MTDRDRGSRIKCAIAAFELRRLSASHTAASRIAGPGGGCTALFTDSDRPSL